MKRQLQSKGGGGGGRMGKGGGKTGVSRGNRSGAPRVGKAKVVAIRNARRQGG